MHCALFLRTVTIRKVALVFVRPFRGFIATWESVLRNWAGIYFIFHGAAFFIIREHRVINWWWTRHSCGPFHSNSRSVCRTMLIYHHHHGNYERQMSPHHLPLPSTRQWISNITCIWAFCDSMFSLYMYMGCMWPNVFFIHVYGLYVTQCFLYTCIWAVCDPMFSLYMYMGCMWLNVFFIHVYELYVTQCFVYTCIWAVCDPMFSLYMYMGCMWLNVFFIHVYELYVTQCFLYTSIWAVCDSMFCLYM